MRVISLNVSKPKTVVHDGAPVSTGIFKEPVVGPRRVRKLGLEGDGQADLKVHGGLDQAVYAYPAEHYEYWRAELGRDRLPYGQFGENLSTEGLMEADARVGEVLKIGGAVLQVTHPRLPCYKLAIRMNAGKTFIKRFQQSGRVGFYLRVLEEGEIAAGDRIEIVEPAEESVSIADFLRLHAEKRPDRNALAHVLSLPALSQGWRARFEKVMARS